MGDSFVGVRFGNEVNLTLCDTEGRPVALGDRVMVRLERGLVQGMVEQVPMPAYKPCQVSSAKRLERLANGQDLENHERKLRRESTAREFARERIAQLRLEMKISRVDISPNGKSATFYFIAENRVDFRQLVRDLGRRFSIRVRMVQLGSRDEAGMLSGMGSCGRTLCCSTWMGDFRPISIQMAKRQNLSLNPSKISGHCGRLLCCLAFEDDNYRGERSSRPRSRGKKGSSRR